MEELEARVTSLESTVATILANLNKIPTITDLKNVLNNIDTRLSALESDVASIKNRLTVGGL
jgi:uncharacterized coiled-coil protein SlyX